MAVTDRVKQNPLVVLVGEPGNPHQPRPPAQPWRARRYGQARHPPGGPGLRARPGALVRAQPGRVRPGLPLPARHRLGLQRLRRAAGLAGAAGRQVRRPGAAHPQGEQQRHPRQGRALLGDHLLRRGRAAPRLRRHRLHHLPRLPAPQHAVPGSARAHHRGQAQGPGRGGVGLPARHRHVQAGRDGHRRHRLRGHHLGAARRPHRQGQAPHGLHRAGGGEEGHREVPDPHRHPHRARPLRRPVVLRREAHRHLLGRRGQGHRGRPLGRQGARRGRRLRQHHGPQRLPAPPRRVRSSCSPT